jgi:hypothetical protein
MPDIPDPRNTDSEDVVWGLQTADTLWKRGERIDALVWLRRAAQAAGDSNDDERAIELARHAAELTEFMNSELDVSETGEVASVFPIVRDSNPDLSNDETGIEVESELGDEDLLEVDEEEEETNQIAAPHLPPPKRPSVPEASELHGGMYDPWAAQNAPRRQAGGTAPLPPPPPSPTSDEEVITSIRSNAMLLPSSEPPAPLQPPTRTQRPSVGSMKAPPPTPSAGPPKPPPPVPRKPTLPKPSVPKITAAPPAPPAAAHEPPPPQEHTAPLKIAGAGSPVAEAIAEALERGLAESMGSLKAAAAPLPETEPLSEPEPEPEAAADEPTTQAPIAAEPPFSAPSTPPEEETLTAQPGTVEPEPPPELEPAAQPDQVVVSKLAMPSIPPAHMLDLEPVEAFSDMPDDVRETFAAAASIHELNEGDEIATFALAYVVKGTFEVAATMVDAAAGRLETGQVLRSRGTTEENVPIRMIAAGGPGVVATWSDAAVEDGFRSIPWVEDDLRAAADKMQTLVGITIGPLGERLDMAIREQVIAKLKMRPLIPAEIVVNKGESVPGLLLVGIGELELMKGDEVAGVVGSGEFLFPTEVLGMGDAPYTARAGKGGALVMFGDRGVAQELLVTCPPLLEVFAGM